MARGFIPDILRANGITDAITRIDTCGGGCISSCFVVFTRSRTLFLKTNSSDFAPVFRGEFASLETIAATHAVLCPTPLFVGTVSHYSYLAMSFLPDLLCASSGVGSAVARLHAAGGSDRFGFPAVTFCGPTSLDNEMTNEPWSVWFSRHRIGHILSQMGGANVTTRPHDLIVERVRQVLQAHDEDVRPCLLHGDLWSGNAGLSSGKACVWDPACYYGDPEVDVATSEMFGGFGSEFYDEYEAARRSAEGYQDRKRVYNLLHILNHARMFGGAFITEASDEIEALFR